jgi:cobalt-precorrin-6B (C15)-methyltransferase
MTLKGGPTQDEVMAISLSKLGLNDGDVFADVGCGTGKVSIAAARVAGTVYAIDRRGEAIACASSEALRSGSVNIRFCEGDALDILQDIEYLDCAFVGGSMGLRSVLECLSEKVKGNIVVNAVMLETLYEAVSTMKRIGIFKEALSVQVCRSYDIAGGTMFRPIDPVYVIAGGRQ